MDGEEQARIHATCDGHFQRNPEKGWTPGGKHRRKIFRIGFRETSNEVLIQPKIYCFSLNVRPFTTRFRRILRAGVSRLRPATTFYLVTRDWTARPLTQVGTDARATFPCFQSTTLVHQTRTAVCKKKKRKQHAQLWRN